VSSEDGEQYPRSKPAGLGTGNARRLGRSHAIAHLAVAGRAALAFLAAIDRACVPAYAFAKGIRLWREELLAYFDEPTTNGYAEGVINKVKVIKRRAYGIPTFTAFRQRVLLACGRTGPRGVAPLDRQEPTFRPAQVGRYSGGAHKRACSTVKSRALLWTTTGRLKAAAKGSARRSVSQGER
jgi:hypothetical protein